MTATRVLTGSCDSYVKYCDKQIANTGVSDLFVAVFNICSPASKPYSMVCDPIHSATNLIVSMVPAYYHQLVEDSLLLYLNPKS